MLPGQHSIGGGKNITPVGPGYYSFNWWLNRTNQVSQRLYVDAPADTYVASGHGGKRTLWIIPGLDLVVCWNDSPIDDHDASPGNPNTKCNQTARLMVEAVGSSAEERKKPLTLALPMNRPTPNPSKEGSRPVNARAQFPSWEGLGVGSGQQIANARSWSLSPLRREGNAERPPSLLLRSVFAQ